MIPPLTRLEKIIFGSLAGFVWLYVALRAYYVGFAFDEAATFLHYVQPGDIWPMNITVLDANNHVLNTLLERISYLLLGPSELSLRLHTLFFAGVYFFYTYLIAKELKNIILRWALIVAFLFPHFLIEFLGLARGYGMSMGLLLASLYHVIIFLKTTKFGHALATVIYISLATLANLTLVNTLLLISGLVIFRYIYQLINEKRGLFQLIAVSVLSGISISWFAWYGFKLKKAGCLYYGNQDGFWKTTVGTLMEFFTWPDNTAGKIVLVVLLVALLAMLVAYLRKAKLDNLFDSGVVFSGLLLGNIAANFLMNWLMGTNFLEDRTGLFYYPLFVLSLCFILDISTFNVKKPASIVLCAVMLFFPINFIGRINLTHSTIWIGDASVKHFYDTILADAGVQHPPPNISGYHMRALLFAYYDYLHNGLLNQPSSINSHTGGEVDYQIVTKEQCQDCDLFEPIDFDPVTEQYIMKRKNRLERETIYMVNDITTNGVYSENFKEFEKLHIDTLTGEILEVEYQLTLDDHGAPFLSWLIVELRDKDGDVIKDFLTGISWKKPHFKGEKDNFHYTVLVSEIPPEAHIIKSFVWNLRMEPFEIVSGQIKLNKLKEAGANNPNN